MKPREAKMIAVQYARVLDFWWDHHAGMRLWTISDVACDGPADYIAPNWLRDMSVNQFHETLEYSAEQYAELRDIKIMLPRRAIKIAAECGVNLTWSGRGYWKMNDADKPGIGTRQMMSMSEDQLRDAIANRNCEKCAICTEIITDGVAYKTVPNRDPKHPPMYTPCHHGCEFPTG